MWLGASLMSYDGKHLIEVNAEANDLSSIRLRAIFANQVGRAFNSD